MYKMEHGSWSRPFSAKSFTGEPDDSTVDINSKFESFASNRFGITRVSKIQKMEQLPQVPPVWFAIFRGQLDCVAIVLGTKFGMFIFIRSKSEGFTIYKIAHVTLPRPIWV